MIDGDTLLVLLEKIADTLPDAVHFVHAGVDVTVIEYGLWKEKMLRYQMGDGRW